MSTAPNRRYTPEEYLAIERDVETKHEFYRGELFAMSGASRVHNRITVNLSASLQTQFKDRNCEHFVNDMRVKISATGLYTYPDVVVTCEKPQFEDDVLDTLVNPQVVMEVLSDSTEKYDRGKKFEHYRRIPTLQCYVLISHDRAHVDRFLLDEKGQWVLSDFNGLDAILDLPTIDCRIPLAEIFAKVDFPEATPGKPEA